MAPDPTGRACGPAPTTDLGGTLATATERARQLADEAARRRLDQLDLPADRSDVEAMRTLRGPDECPGRQLAETVERLRDPSWTMPELDPEPMTCPRCRVTVMQRLYGPCETCRSELSEPDPGRAAGPAGDAPTGPVDPSRPGTSAEGSSPAGDDGAPVLRTRRQRRAYRTRVREWAPVLPTVHDQLAELSPAVEAVHLVGELGTAADVTAWATGLLPDGWAHHPDGHYLHGTSPVLRYIAPDGHRLELHSAAAWWGDVEGLTAELAGEAWRILGERVAATFDEGQLLATPPATGRYLFLRTIPHGHEGWPVMPDELQRLVRSTSGQGRVELFPRPEGDQLDRLVCLDGRLMYGALCWGLPGGPVRHDRSSEWDPQQRGRYRVTFTVPDDWRHVGILGVHDGDGWAWPSAPGTSWETWADGAELLVAHRHGWAFDVHERLTWEPYRGRGPLDTWAAKLVAMRDQLTARAAVGADDARACELAAAGVRSMLLHALGAFHGAGHRLTKAGELGDVPDGADGWRRAGDVHLWADDGGQAWPEMAHPEWSASVWARCRARLLDGPTGTKGVRAGMLTMDPATLVATRTDAIYATVDPGWPDDGKPGRFRVKSARQGPLSAPQTAAELLTMMGRD